MSQLELNRGDQFIFGVDVSASMQTTDAGPSKNKSRIEYLKEKVITFATEASKWDPDGIDVYTFGAKITPYLNVTAEKAGDVIGALRANEGTTDTAAFIEEAYKRHLAIGSSENTVTFIATDGAPNDPGAVKRAIVKITKDIKSRGASEHSFALSFLTVGVIDAGLQAFLTELDDDLKDAEYDIVDVKALDDVDFLAAFSGALHD